jgi:hypothetical protein
MLASGSSVSLAASASPHTVNGSAVSEAALATVLTKAVAPVELLVAADGTSETQATGGGGLAVGVDAVGAGSELLSPQAASHKLTAHILSTMRPFRNSFMTFSLGFEAYFEPAIGVFK